MVGVLTQVSCQLLFGLDVVKLVNSRYNYTSASPSFKISSYNNLDSHANGAGDSQ